MSYSTEARTEARRTLEALLPASSTAYALVTGYTPTAAAPVLELAVLALDYTDGPTPTLRNVSREVAILTDQAFLSTSPTRPASVLRYSGFPAELIGTLSRVLYGDVMFLDFDRL